MKNCTIKPKLNPMPSPEQWLGQWLGTTLVILFLVALNTTASAQYGPCANNNNQPPQAGPPLPAANTMLIDASAVPQGSDFCIGNQNPPAPQTIGGCGSFTFFNIPPGTANCNTQICFTPKQGCGNAIGDVCVWEENPPGTWFLLGSPTAATGEICIEFLPQQTQYTITICRPGNGPVSVQDVNVILCCQLDVTCPPPGPINLTCASQIPVVNNANAAAAFAALGGIVVGSCNPVTITVSDQSSGAGCIGNPLTLIRTFTITDPLTQETATCPVTYSVVDDVDPILNGCPPPAIVLACNPPAIPSCAIVPMPTATDNCSTVTVICMETPITNTSACGRTRTLTWTATDLCQNTAVCSSVYTWEVDPPVTLNCPQNTTIGICSTQVAVNAAYNAWLATASFSGGCNAVLSNNSQGPPAACGGTVTVTFTVQGECAPPTSCQATFTVTAPSQPVLNCPQNITATACQTQAAITAQYNAWLVSVSGSGGCNGIITSDNPGAPSACGGSTTVTYTLTSDCHPPLTCQATFSVAAPQTVMLTCPINTTVASCQTQAAINAQFNAWLASASASGGCNGVLTNNNQGAPPACGGTTTVTFTYTSTCTPTTTTCMATFTVAFPNDVVLSGCPPMAVQLACNPTIPSCTSVTAPAASGGCSPTVICVETPITNTSACGRTRTLTWTATDNCNQSTSCSTVYTWTEDVTPPVLSGCPPPTVDLGCNPTFVPSCQNVPPPVANDLCNGAVPIPTLCTESMVSINGCNRSRILTWTATDACGNSASCSTTFNWIVTTPIVLTCPADLTTGACLTQAAVNTAYNNWLASVTASGGCNVVITNNSIDPPDRCGGSRTVTFNAAGDCQQFATCTATFTVPASPTVVLTCPINTTVGACQTQAAINAQFNAWLATASASGGCNGVLTNNNQGAPSACGGNTVVTFIYTSTCSPLTTSCTAAFTVAAPATVQLTCPINSTVGACQTQAAINAQFNAWLATASASGGCNGVLTNNNTGAPSACGGNTVVTFTYTSTCFPFTTTCTATFTVAAPPPVQLTCPAPMVMNPCSTQAQVNAAYAAWLASATASGGCNGSLTNNNTLGAPTICNTGSVTRTITWTYTSTCSPFTTTCTSTFTLPAYPDFTVPANGAATVACPAQATPPMPPLVLNGCGGVITPTGPVVTNNPNPLTCEGTRTYTWTYTDCAGRVKTWSFVYTVERLDFTVPANGGATVDCPDDTDIVPNPPIVLSNCGEVLTPVLINTDAKPLCEGARRYTWRYTDCEGNSHDWSFVYTIVYQDFTVPSIQRELVECPQAAVEPVPPTVFDNCGVEVVPVGPSISSTYNAFGCEATRTYSYVYTDCSGFSHAWAFIYGFQYLGEFAIYADQYNEVSCIKHVVEPIPPTIYDNCGSPVSVWLSGVWEDIDPLGCMGTRIYTFTYRDCGGRTQEWKFTYFVKDDIAPMGTIPDVDEEVACLEDLPCPDDDFSDKMAEIIAEGDFYDNCKEPIAMLHSWTDVVGCSDPDGDGVFTFSRTYYFVIKDCCGNTYPEFVPVTYFGLCQPLGSFSMSDWGIEGDEPSLNANANTDLEVIQQLLGNSIKIGGTARSLTVNNAQCVMDLLPGTGGPSVLSDCHQVNCTGCNEMGVGGMKNALAANAIALELNIRYGVVFNGMSGAEAIASPLDCINLHPCITNCNAAGVCYLRIFDAFGEEYSFPYTVGGLQDLVNLYLNGALDLSGGLGVIYGTALNQSLLMLNSYGNDEMLAALCTDDDGQDLWSNGFDDLGSIEEIEWSPDFEINPNPASDAFAFRLAWMEQPSDVVLTFYNSLGQVVLIQQFDQVQLLNESIRIDGLKAGLYVVDVKLGAKHYNTRLVVQR